MTQTEYMDYAECRQASFTYKKAKRFRDWLDLSKQKGLEGLMRPNDDIVEILGFLAWEMVGRLTETSLRVKRNADLAASKRELARASKGIGLGGSVEDVSSSLSGTGDGHALASTDTATKGGEPVYDDAMRLPQLLPRRGPIHLNAATYDPFEEEAALEQEEMVSLQGINAPSSIQLSATKKSAALRAAKAAAAVAAAAAAAAQGLAEGEDGVRLIDGDKVLRRAEQELMELASPSDNSVVDKNRSTKSKRSRQSEPGHTSDTSHLITNKASATHAASPDGDGKDTHILFESPEPPPKRASPLKREHLIEAFRRLQLPPQPMQAFKSGLFRKQLLLI